VPRARLTVLCDNEALPGLAAEWGFSLLVATPAGHRLLWDAGKTGVFLDNAATLGLDLGHLDAGALSHGHYDHGDGMPLLRKRTGFSGPVFAHPGHAVDRWAREDDGSARVVGLSPAARQAMSGFAAVDRTRDILPGVVMLTAIPRLPDNSTATAGMFLDPAFSTPDPLPDDACLVLDSAAGPVLILGCCHSGLANTLAQVRAVLGHTRLAAAVGGLHLYDAGPAAWAETRDALREFGVERVFPGHCTGQPAVEWLARELPGRVAPLVAGRVLEF
jgi:7,8-dihydropterin-6-yl-methyl-4-(beta-D-ribofuranosyl)aminobenzene 5'-phosphate synthase